MGRYLKRPSDVSVEIFLDLLKNAINLVIIEDVGNQLDRDGNSLLDEVRKKFQQDIALFHYVSPFW